MISLKRLFVISRPIVYLPSIALYSAGLLSSRAPFDWRWIAGAILFTICMSIVGYGLNDIADRESDALNARKGGIDGAVLSRAETRQLLLVISSVIAISLLILLFTRSIGLLISGLAVYAFAIAYSVPPIRLKVRPVLDSLSNGLWAVIMYMGGYWASVTDGALTWPPAYLVIALWVSAAALHAYFAVIDHDADKAVGDRTISVAFGKRPTLIFCATAFVVGCILTVRLNPILGIYELFAAVICLIGLRDPRPEPLRRLGYVIIFSLPICVVAIQLWRA